MYISQWSRLCKNVGVWQGSFTDFSPEAKELKSTDSELILELVEPQKLKLTLQRDNKNTIVNEFTSLNSNIFLFEDGHFSKGSQQFTSFSLFAAEYGFVIDDRRCRLVQLYKVNGELDVVILIREFRQDGKGIESPMLSLAQLEGEWIGEACTLYPDWRDTPVYQTKLTIKRDGEKLRQTLQTPEINFTSEGIINGNTVNFSQRNQDIRLLLLPDGVSSTSPIQIKSREAFFVEFAWLLSPHQRLRIVRQYDNEGRWVNVTLVKESKINQ